MFSVYLRIQNEFAVWHLLSDSPAVCSTAPLSVVDISSIFLPLSVFSPAHRSPSVKQYTKYPLECRS